jgi:adenine-specific DNA-methyltransferase
LYSVFVFEEGNYKNELTFSAHPQMVKIGLKRKTVYKKMSKYTCVNCLKVFKQKSHFEVHQNRKTPCKKQASIEELVEQKVQEALSKMNITVETTIQTAPETEHDKKALGQYFTTSDVLQQYVFEKVKYKSSRLLEPSFGAGHLLKKFKEYDIDYPMDCYEIDTKIRPVIDFNEHQTVNYADFTQETIATKYKTIIGNPPYIKQKTGNLYLKFIELCYNYLDNDGELILIVPSDFIKLTSASSIIDKMTGHGSFTDFWFPHNEKLFDGASIDVVVFRYQKGLSSSKANVNGEELFCNVNQGIITFSETEVSGASIDTLFNVYVGLVSGRDEIYRVPFGNIELLTDKNKIEKFIFTETFPTNNFQIDNHLQAHKADLLERKIRTFSEKNWFEWGAPRNISSVRKLWGKQCIYLKTITRQKEVAFLGKVQYFGGGLLCLVPKTEIELQKIIDYFNSPSFQKDYVFAGRFKIGHKQICSSYLRV